MTNDPTSRTTHDLPGFNAHAVAIARRQYFQPGEETVDDMFRRVATWVARAEAPAAREEASAAFYRLMADQRFCPGGRVLAGAATTHGNVLNCFVQDGRPDQPGSDAWVMTLAGKLAAVTKVGGGNGVNLDPIGPKRDFQGRTGKLYLTADAAHPDYDKIRTGTFLDLVKGETLTRGYRAATFVETGAVPAGATVRRVGDSVDDIWAAAADMVKEMLNGGDVLVDLSDLRPEGTEVRGSGGSSSGPASFGVEVFDNFAIWAGLGGAAYAGPVATLRFVFAPTLRAIRQGGCLHPDTLVHTSRGTLRLEELVDGHQPGWQDHHVKVATDQGWKDSQRGFNNGVVDTLRVTLANGQTLRGTANHKLKVLRVDGTREWVKIEDLRRGDHVIQALDQHTGTPVTLRPVDAPHHNAKEIRTPEVLDERLALFLGYLWGDGFVSGNRVGYAVAHGSPMIDEGPRLFTELFGLDVATEQKRDDLSLVYVTRSAHLVAWLRANGLEKGRARDLAIPKAIRMSPRPIVGSFMRGLFEADGTLSHGMPALSTASVRLAEDVQTMLAGLGIPSTRRSTSGVGKRYSRHSLHSLRVVSHKGHERYCERIGFIPGSRLAKAQLHLPDEAREKSWIFPHAEAPLVGVFDAMPVGVKGRPSEYTATRKDLSRYIRGERYLSATSYDRLRTKHQLADRLPAFGYDEYLVPVVFVGEAGRALTLDLSVDENKTYLAGGFVSHNTRRGAGMATISITHPDVGDFITAKDHDRERFEGDISTFNISVLVTDDFMTTAVPHRRGVLWDIASHAWATGEPGLIYVDRINEHNPMRAELGDILSTNPCGEIPLYPGEPCDLGAINLAAYVVQPGQGLAGFDLERFRADTRTCVRFLDDVLDVNVFALEDNRDMSMKLRRLGLGVMGLADALIRMGYSYASDSGRAAVTTLIDALRESATEASEELAAERGAFPLAARADIETPRRNVAVLTVAPTGTTSMLMGVSSGVEPVFAPYIHRKIGTEYHALVHPLFEELMEGHPPAAGYASGEEWDWDKVLAAVQANHGSVQGLGFVPEAVRAVLVCAHDIAAEDHVRMQAAVQRAFDGGARVANSISKTINMANDATIDDVFDAYSLAFSTGCKGITVYRDGSRDFQVLSTSSGVAEKVEESAPVPVQAEVMEVTVAAQRPMPVVGAAEPVAPVAGASEPVAPVVGASEPVVPVAGVAGPVTRSGAASRSVSAPAKNTRTAGSGGPHYDRLPGEPLFDRPLRLHGQTDQVKLMLPNGDKRGFYVTVNMQDGLPTEVFIASGKAGDEANADSEALGRVVSIALQYGVPAEALVKTLRGINGGMYGTYQGRLVASKADLLAVALETAGVENVLNRDVGCPDCGAPLRFEEGCQKCESCGYSKCG